MPVDRELAIESLKRLDTKLYDMHRKLKEVEDYVKNDIATFQKLRIYLLSLDALDNLEAAGLIQVINDYENKTILLKRNQT